MNDYLPYNKSQLYEWRHLTSTEWTLLGKVFWKVSTSDTSWARGGRVIFVSQTTRASHFTNQTDTLYVCEMVRVVAVPQRCSGLFRWGGGLSHRPVLLTAGVFWGPLECYTAQITVTFNCSLTDRRRTSSPSLAFSFYPPLIPRAPLPHKSVIFLLPTQACHFRKNGGHQ